MAMAQLYPEQLPNDVRENISKLALATWFYQKNVHLIQIKEKAAYIAASLQVERFATKKELTRMTQLTAECSKLFPPDFVSIDRDEILLQVTSINGFEFLYKSFCLKYILYLQAQVTIFSKGWMRSNDDMLFYLFGVDVVDASFLLLNLTIWKKQ